MIDEELSDTIKKSWQKYSNLFPEDKTNLIDKIFTEIYEILNESGYKNCNLVIIS